MVGDMKYSDLVVNYYTATKNEVLNMDSREQMVALESIIIALFKSVELREHQASTFLAQVLIAASYRTKIGKMMSDYVTTNFEDGVTVRGIRHLEGNPMLRLEGFHIECSVPAKVTRNFVIRVSDNEENEYYLLSKSYLSNDVKG